MDRARDALNRFDRRLGKQLGHLAVASHRAELRHRDRQLAYEERVSSRARGERSDEVWRHSLHLEPPLGERSHMFGAHALEVEAPRVRLLDEPPDRQLRIGGVRATLEQNENPLGQSEQAFHGSQSCFVNPLRIANGQQHASGTEALITRRSSNAVDSEVPRPRLRMPARRSVPRPTTR